MFESSVLRSGSDFLRDDYEKTVIVLDGIACILVVLGLMVRGFSEHKKGGSPGHVVMIVDICENEQSKKTFLLAQGYMPAQEFHVLKNLLHEENPKY